MVRAKVIKAVNHLKRSLEKSGVKAEKIIVFGSQARGTTHKDSDIDIIVVSGDFKGKDLFKRAKITGDAHWDIMQDILIPLDIIAMTPEEYKGRTSLTTGFVRDGEVIYS